jgi:hypothetical protein
MMNYKNYKIASTDDMFNLGSKAVELEVVSREYLKYAMSDDIVPAEQMTSMLDLLIELYSKVIKRALCDEDEVEYTRIFVAQAMIYGSYVIRPEARSKLVHHVMLKLARINSLVLQEYVPEKIGLYIDFAGPLADRDDIYWRLPLQYELAAREHDRIRLAHALLGFSTKSNNFIYHAIIGHTSSLETLISNISQIASLGGSSYQHGTSKLLKSLQTMKIDMNNGRRAAINEQLTMLVNRDVLTGCFSGISYNEGIKIGRLEFVFLIFAITILGSCYIATRHADLIIKAQIHQTFGRQFAFWEKLLEKLFDSTSIRASYEQLKKTCFRISTMSRISSIIILFDRVKLDLGELFKSIVQISSLFRVESNCAIYSVTSVNSAASATKNITDGSNIDMFGS